MAPVLIEPLSEKAYELLQQLEALNILRVVKSADAVTSTPVHKPSIAGLVGSLSDETAQRMRTETTQMRNEWEREF
ncbi:hypothetical protein [Hymenobacter ruricola]|uniref:Uncharacterized protein n=1 Tax=Hymenobacter ruricola TaxID=2791023 RepID=A0ABS0I682_9BACT|nr:hypothetical protein [Hymenobacter ruricola]MBF9222412.1 hypothetical protein [Hymenobacter ruricola]